MAGLCFGGMNASIAVNEQCAETGLAETRFFCRKKRLPFQERCGTMTSSSCLISRDLRPVYRPLLRAAPPGTYPLLCQAGRTQGYDRGSGSGVESGWTQKQKTTFSEGGHSAGCFALFCPCNRFIVSSTGKNIYSQSMAEKRISS